MESIIWHMALIIGSAVFLIGVIYLISRKKRTRTDYIKAVAIELLASWFLWLPHELYKEVTVDGRFLHILESVLTAVIRTFNVFSIEAYEKVIYPGSEELTSAFAIVRVLVSISVALFSFGWIMTFFDGPLQRIKLFFNRNEPTFVFPEFNEKTASIARSVDRDFGNKANIVFLAHEEVPESSKSEIEEIGGMVMKTSLPLMIHNLVKHSGEINVYIFGRDDEDNLKQLEDAFDEGMVDKCRKIHFFVELTETPWALCDDYVSRKLGDHDADVVVNFVRTEENAVYHILWRHSFLKHVHIERDGMKKAEVLIAGVNARSIEMIRTILPLTQMPGYSLSLTVLDEGENLAKLQAQMPSIVFNKPYRHWGDAVYSITYLENVALDEVLPDSVSEAISSFTYAYVNTGDDIRNVTLAIRLDHERQRAAVSEEADAAVGYEIMVDASRIEEKMLKRDSLRHILFSGNFEKVYSREFSSMSEFETASIAVHEQRQKEKVAKAEEKGETARETPWQDYCNSEYSRRSVYARTLSLRYKLAVLRKEYGDPEGKHLKDQDWQIAEHMRWDIYTRIIGYIDPDETMKRLFREAMEKGEGQGKKLAKALRNKTYVHEDLVSYDLLPESEKDGNDEITITEKVRKQLETNLDLFEGKN